jgi:hypothetical protein
VVVLGSPVGEPEFEGETCLAKVRRLKKLAFLETEEEVPIQSRYIMLKESILPTFTHLMRTVPPWNLQNAMSIFDRGIKDAVKRLLGAAQFEDEAEIEACSQIHLPLRHGGLGLPEASTIATPAYVASIWEAGIMLDTETRDMVASRLQTEGVRISEEDLQNQAPHRKQQRLFMEDIMKSKAASLLQHSSDGEDKARIRASQQPGAQDWLGSLPTSSAKSFSDMQWQLAVRLRLGLRINKRSLPTNCPICEGEVHDINTHAFECNYSEMKTARTERHNMLRDVLIGGLSAWGFQVEKEPLIEQGRSFRGDLLVPHANGPVILDVAVSHPSATHTQQNVYTSGGTMVRERLKNQYYSAMCRRVQKEFTPFVLQTWGGIGSQGLSFFQDLKSRPACLRVFDPVGYVGALRQTLSCRLIKANIDILTRWLQLSLPMESGGVIFSSS